MIRVLVVISSVDQPAWVGRVVQRIRDSAFAKIAAFVTDAKPLRRRRGLLRSLYERIDSAWFGRAGDALARHDLSQVVSAHRGGEGEYDVILAFDALVPRALGEKARHGVWTCHFDQWNAFAARYPTTICTVEEEIDSERSVIATTRAATDLISMRRGMSRLAWRTATLLLRSLERLAEGRGARTPAAIAAPPAGRTARAIGGALTRYAVQLFRDRWTVEQWSVAFRFGDRTMNLEQFHEIAPPADRLWADPFVVHQGDRALIFVEELVYSENRGVIAVMEAYPDGSFSKPHRVLERPYHLSYPCVFRHGNDWFMLPETMENETIELYRAVDFPRQWAPAAVLVRNIHAVDTTLFEHDGRWWMYSTTSADGKMFDELSAYHSSSPLGPWIPHPLNPLMSDIVGGRCAGRPFHRDGRLLRAAQIGAPRYGYAIQIREIVKLTPEEWEEREVSTIGPWASTLAGTHTLNVDGDVTVIDALRYRWRR